MDSFPSPSTRGERPNYNVLGGVLSGVAALALGLSFLSVPGRPDTRLDASWQEMLILARDRGLQFGRDVIFTWGPWGFLCSRFHLGATEAVPILLWQTLGQLLIAACLVALTFRLPVWRRAAFVAAVLAVHWLFLDSVYFVLITLVAVAGLMDTKATLLRLFLWAVLLGFLSQLKFTYGVISAAAVGCAGICWLVRRSPGRIVSIGAGFVASTLVAWVAAGQDIDNLYPYVRRSLEISSGYGQAMGFDEPWSVFLWGSALVLACAAFAWSVWRSALDRGLALGSSLFFAFVVLVMWKESYTRADMVPLGGHIFGLFTFAMILAPVLPGLLFPGRRFHAFDAVLPGCVVAIACFDGAYFTEGPRVAWERIYGNARALSTLGGLAGSWQGDYAAACKGAELPAIKAAVGTGTADVYDYNLGAAILNGLPLSARPVFQGYSAYTPSLEGYNLRHYQSARAPDYLLWNRETVDNRYPGLDDAPLVAGLAGHYEPLFSEAGYWLFHKRTTLSTAPLERRLLFSRTVRFSEEVVLPEPIDHALWLEVAAEPTAIGRMRAVAYKEALLLLTTTDDSGRRSSWRLVPKVARAGFILVPTLQDGSDVAALMHGEFRSSVRSFHLEAPAGQEEFWSHADVRVSVLQGLPIRPAPPLQWLVELGIFDRPPMDVTSAAVQQVIDVREGRALQVHAEGEVVLEVRPGDTALSLGYGIREGAYTGVGHTDGVAFTLDAVWASGKRTRLWERYLAPVSRVGDRGMLTLSLALPSDLPQRLVLHTGIGPKGDDRWDWSYVSAVKFQSAPRP